ncbi:DUF2339 domain-containing protein [Flammeovirga yaeyamensis]|uniref:DUF2339 domain-containing protein n=1 Tax=Flammeovirga yaeyamensis TaxID=367791 RepID=A0AAX1NDR8_9BACT|nr:DUF2339 domain-containing protein [Flammeovirga yaeyamensis]MBB3699956.1 putative membrane protein [Flammeovirga yaeyamensis]NMF37605.1 DUF2339 domain-containing protein [Flammeovirga yaeyamensis]QWG04661.1 DUF2339 domain-containing protein [Flammeovirga yaeyamensis]
MTNDQDKIYQLEYKLEQLTKKHQEFHREMNDLKFEINFLKKSLSTSSEEEKVVTPIIKEAPKRVEVEDFDVEKENKAPVRSNPIKQAIKKPREKTDFERWIGENLINKIGILITIIGVAIGAKYSIDNNLISPLTRIILGYFVGLGLMGFGIKLKKNYLNFSAVLVSGAMAIMYFITFAAYSFYDLIPQMLTFALMLLFTIFTVLAALNYNKQVIAIIGLVGAYALPYLLSTGTGNVAILFSYIAMINIGILVISFKKLWKQLYYTTFVLTNLIYSSWFAFAYRNKDGFAIAFSFLIIFFVIFYITSLAYKLINKEKLEKVNITILLSNAFIFFGIGMNLLDRFPSTSDYLGVFTLFNALIHAGVAFFIYKKNYVEKSLLKLIAGLVLIFVTITFPIQLDGEWVTLFWIGEAILLFWLGRKMQISYLERFSHPLILLSFISLVSDWEGSYYRYNADFTQIFNIHFFTNLFFVGAFGFMVYLMMKSTYKTTLKESSFLHTVVKNVISGAFLFVLYFTFYLEIDYHFNHLFESTAIDQIGEENAYNPKIYNYNISTLGGVWSYIYTFIFVTVLSLINVYKIKDKKLSNISLGLIGFTLLSFLINGLLLISDLRENYILRDESEYFIISIFNIVIRYISFVFLGATLYAGYKLVQQNYYSDKIRLIGNGIFHFVVLWILSSELIHWMDLAESTQSYKLGLSILWGLYSLFMISLGIGKNVKYLRLGAIFLFGITLLKLFFYDIIHLNTIAKTIVFVSLGILLLIISFLYNKFKHKITDEVSN